MLPVAAARWFQALGTWFAARRAVKSQAQGHVQSLDALVTGYGTLQAALEWPVLGSAPGFRRRVPPLPV